MTNQNSNKNYYEILNISIDAEFEDIKKSYRKLALLYHPDKNSNTGDIVNNNSVVINDKLFNDIQIAWETLKDDISRKQYDSLLLDSNTTEKKRQKYSVSDEIDLDDMQYNEEDLEFIHPCRCGDHYIITEDQLSEGKDVVCCSGCSLSIKVIYQVEN